MSASTTGRIATALLAMFATASCGDPERPATPGSTPASVTASTMTASGTTASGVGSGLPPSGDAGTGDAGTGHAGEAESTGPAGKLLCFGDSITQADWPGKIAPDEKWVTALGSKSTRITTVNAGRNGRTTAEGLIELPPVLDQHGDAAYVLFFLGVNDVKHADSRTVERATANMGKIVDLTRLRLPKAVIVILAPVDVTVDRLSTYFRDEAGMGPDTPHYMNALRLAYRTLAEKKGVQFIDLLHAVTPAFVEDGVHPNGKGQLQIAEAVWKGLVEISASR